jgi:hypothetical protein
MITGAWTKNGKVFLPNYFWRIAFTTEIAFKEDHTRRSRAQTEIAVLVSGITSM